MNSVFVRLDFGGSAKFGYLEIRILFGVRDFASVPNGAAGAASRPHMVQGGSGMKAAAGITFFG